jgi:hypothetical protein
VRFSSQLKIRNADLADSITVGLFCKGTRASGSAGEIRGPFSSPRYAFSATPSCSLVLCFGLLTCPIRLMSRRLCHRYVPCSTMAHIFRATPHHAKEDAFSYRRFVHPASRCLQCRIFGRHQSQVLVMAETDTGDEGKHGWLTSSPLLAVLPSHFVRFEWVHPPFAVVVTRWGKYQIRDIGKGQTLDIWRIWQLWKPHKVNHLALCEQIQLCAFIIPPWIRFGYILIGDSPR